MEFWLGFGLGAGVMLVVAVFAFVGLFKLAKLIDDTECNELRKK